MKYRSVCEWVDGKITRDDEPSKEQAERVCEEYMRIWGKSLVVKTWVETYIDEAADNFKNGIVSEPIELDKYLED